MVAAFGFICLFKSFAASAIISMVRRFASLSPSKVVGGGPGGGVIGLFGVASLGGL